MEDIELKSNPALPVQKQLRNEKIKAKRNIETVFFLKRKIGNKTERKKNQKRNENIFARS
jgi:hypothetical protein